MRVLVACLACLVGCSSSSYLEPLGEPAADASPDAVVVAQPAPDATLETRAVEPETAADAAVVDVAAPDVPATDAREAAVLEVLVATETAPPDVAPEADAAPETTVVDAWTTPAPAVAGEWCGRDRACAAEGLPLSENGTSCFTDIAPVAYNIGDPPILTYCAKRCLVSNRECIGWGGGCCATVRFADGTEGNACVSPENCKW